MNTLALIDYCLREYARDTTDSVSRAKVLDWINAAERKVLSAGPDWWFLYKEVDFNFVAGTALYACEPEWEEVVDLYSSALSTPMTQLPERVFNSVLRPTVVSGTPTHWATQSRTENTQVLNVIVWPNPSNDAAGGARVKLYPVTLTDQNTSYSRIPEHHRMILADEARAEMKRDMGELDKAQVYQAAADQKMQAIMAEQARRGGRH